MQRTYDRTVPAPLPPSRMLTREAAEIPQFVDLRRFCGPMKDQSTEGACTGHAGTSAREWINRAYLHRSGLFQFSPQYTYARSLMAQGSFPNDVGSDGTTLCGTLIVNGCCELGLYPYVAGQILKPTPEQDTNAAKHVLGAFHGLAGSTVALSVLGDKTPWPVMVGFTVYDSFESDAVAKTGIYNPQPGERVLGGHEVLAVGYDVGSTPTIRPQGCPPAVLIQNSWSENWGLKGYFWMTMRVLDDPQSDLKIAHSGHPW
jgi:hypothetical protein